MKLKSGTMYPMLQRLSEAMNYAAVKAFVDGDAEAVKSIGKVFGLALTGEN